MRQMSKAGPTEHEIQSQILDWLRIEKIFHYRNNTGAFSGEYKGKRWFARFGKKGAPDIVAVHRGLYIGIEVKRPGKPLSPEQEAFRCELESHKGIYVWATKLEDVQELFRNIVTKGNR